jgi:hypothetical protein
MNKLLFSMLFIPVLGIAEPINITFNNSLPVTVSDPANFFGCHTSSYNYAFDVTMMGYNYNPSTCTQTNLFPNAGYLTAGQWGPRGPARMNMNAPAGVTFELVNFIVKNYGNVNTLYLDTTDSFGNVSTRVLKASIGAKLYSFSGLTDLVGYTLRSTNARFDITAITLVDSTVIPPPLP